MYVYAFILMTVVVITCLTVIFNVSCKVCSDKFFHITAAATDHFYSLGLKDILGTLAHIAGKHDYHAHLSENRSDSAFAATAFRRSHLADVCHLAVKHVKYRIVCTMTEVVIHTSISCWYCYFHNIYSSSLLYSIALFI